MLEGLIVPNSSSSALLPNFPIFGSSVSSSSTSSSTVKPSTSSSSSVKPTTSSSVSSSTNVTDQITRISQIINEARYNLDTSKIYIAEGIVVARDNLNRPYIMDDHGDVILIYNYNYDLEIGDRIRVKGTIDVYNDLIEFSNSGIQSLEILARGVSFDFPPVAVYYTIDEYFNDSGIHLNGKLIGLANVNLQYNGKINFTDYTAQKVRAYNNLDDFPYLNYETDGNEYIVYGFYYGKSTTMGKICIAWVDEIEHKHNYQPRITWHVDWAHPADFEVSCECGKITYDYSFWTEEIERKEATCTQEGYITYRGYINYNGELYYEDQIKYLPPVEHDYQPRFTWTGDLAVPVVMDMVCSNDESHVNYYCTTTMQILEQVNPTCESDGYMLCEGVIEYNGNTYSEQRWIELPSLGHSYDENMICTKCYESYYTQGMVYDLSEDGMSYILVDMGTQTKNEIIIPPTYNGLPVTAIGDNVFKNSSVENVVLPETITHIGSHAFDFCENIKSITLPESLQTIGEGAFSCMYSLQDIEIPSSVKVISNGAFAYSSIENIVLHEGLEEIGGFAFGYCGNLKNLYIPSTVTVFGDVPFYSCGGLETIVVSENNPIYDSRDNCNAIIITDKNSLFFGCKTTVIPNTVTELETNCFVDNTEMIYMVIPDSVTYMGGCIFRYCENLSWVVLPNTINLINGQVFEGCESLIKIFYTGTQEEWENIQIDDYDSSNKVLQNVEIIFNYSHGEEHNNQVFKKIDATENETGEIRMYCPCGYYDIFHDIAPCKQILTAEKIYGDKVDLEYEYSSFDGTYCVDNTAVYSKDVLVNKNFTSKPLIEMKDCINGVEPTITVSLVSCSSIYIDFYVNNSYHAYAGYVDVLFNGEYIQGVFMSEVEVRNGEYIVTYYYVLPDNLTGSLSIVNHDNGTKLISSIYYN